VTIADADPEAGTIALVIQAVGKSSGDLVALEPESHCGHCRPLGNPPS
jgi:threonine dehydrogenase-like Zn-dependent dehydrogenase